MITDLVTFLEDAPAISAIVGSRIYPEALPQKPTYPALTYQLVSAVRVEDLSGPAGKCRRRISINCWAATEIAAYQLADAVRQSLNGFHGWMADTRIQSTRLDNEWSFPESEAGVTGIYRVTQDYIIGYLEA
jgi:hypothetical protein